MWQTLQAGDLDEGVGETRQIEYSSSLSAQRVVAVRLFDRPKMLDYHLQVGQRTEQIGKGI